MEWEAALGYPQKVASCALAGAVVILSACTHDYSDRTAYGIYGCDGVRVQACNYPVYSAKIAIGGTSYSNLRYRDVAYGREFWLNGTWRKADPGQPYGRV
jgi:hypothetical protein